MWEDVRESDNREGIRVTGRASARSIEGVLKLVILTEHDWDVLQPCCAAQPVLRGRGESSLNRIRVLSKQDAGALNSGFAILSSYVTLRVLRLRPYICKMGKISVPNTS